MTLPDPRATRLQNMVATLLAHGNAKHQLNLSVLARHNPPWTEEEMSEEFDRQATALSLKLRTYEGEAK